MHTTQCNVPGPAGLGHIHPLAGSSWTLCCSSGDLCFVCLFLQLAVVPPKPGAGEMPHCSMLPAPGSAESPGGGLALPCQLYLPLDLLSSVHVHASTRQPSQEFGYLEIPNRRCPCSGQPWRRTGGKLKLKAPVLFVSLRWISLCTAWLYLH